LIELVEQRVNKILGLNAQQIEGSVLLSGLTQQEQSDMAEQKTMDKKTISRKSTAKKRAPAKPKATAKEKAPPAIKPETHPKPRLGNVELPNLPPPSQVPFRG